MSISDDCTLLYALDSPRLPFKSSKMETIFHVVSLQSSSLICCLRPQRVALWWGRKAPAHFVDTFRAPIASSQHLTST